MDKNQIIEFNKYINFKITQKNHDNNDLAVK